MKQNALATRMIRRLRGVRAVPGAVPPVGLVVLGILSVQIGAVFAKALFPVLGPYGTVFLRLVFAALILMVVWRPRVRGHRGRDYLLVLLFGLVFAAMNTSFYAALNRLPLGVAVTVEFVGPLGVAVFGSRRLLDLLWAVLAAGGIVLLTPLTGVSGVPIDPLGLALALLAGLGWAASACGRGGPSPAGPGWRSVRRWARGWSPPSASGRAAPTCSTGLSWRRARQWHCCRRCSRIPSNWKRCGSCPPERLAC
jgi:drug/metabolite transporter (DMT)-like permease